MSKLGLIPGDFFQLGVVTGDSRSTSHYFRTHFETSPRYDRLLSELAGVTVPVKVSRCAVADDIA